MRVDFCQSNFVSFFFFFMTNLHRNAVKISYLFSYKQQNINNQIKYLIEKSPLDQMRLEQNVEKWCDTPRDTQKSCLERVKMILEGVIRREENKTAGRPLVTIIQAKLNAIKQSKRLRKLKYKGKQPGTIKNIGAFGLKIKM